MPRMPWDVAVKKREYASSGRSSSTRYVTDGSRAGGDSDGVGAGCSSAPCGTSSAGGASSGSSGTGAAGSFVFAALSLALSLRPMFARLHSFNHAPGGRLGVPSEDVGPRLSLLEVGPLAQQSPALPVQLQYRALDVGLRLLDLH